MSDFRRIAISKDDEATFRPPPPRGNSFVRFITAHAKAHVMRGRTPPLDIAKHLWPHDRIVIGLLERAASTPAMTTVTGWAAELAQTAIIEFTEALHGQSAAAAVFEQSLRLSWDRAAQIKVPGFASAIGTDTAAFVAEGAPIPMYQPTATSVTMLPHKAASIFTLTREMIESSNAEAMVRDLASRALGRVLDEVLFDANPQSASRPPGLRQGVAALTASTAGDPWHAFADDMAKLVDAVAPVAGNSPIVFIGSPGRAFKTGIYMSRDPQTIPTYGSGAVINDFLCVATAALVAAIEPVPEVETSTIAAVHEDTVPQPLMSAGTVRSLFQTDTVGFKVKVPVSWGLRNSAGFAWLTPTGW